ncbi:MAG: M23 family metallopeptidase [Vicinamibacterales bacterium]
MRTCLALLAVLAWVQPSPPLSMRVTVPPGIVATDGRQQLSYELHVENRGESPVVLSRLEIEGDTHMPTVRLEGDRLARALDAPPDLTAPLAIPSHTQRIVYLDLPVPATAVPAVLRHELRFSTAAGPGRLSDGETGVRVDATPPAVLGAPLAGGPWVAVHHPDWERGHRRVFYTVDGVIRLPGRHAIDFVKVDETGRTAHDDADLVVNAFGYGAEVLAVSDAVVAMIRDTIPEVTRVSARVKHAQEDAAGNFVALDHGAGRFVVYEHLKPGSVRVRTGQRVRRGDVVGQLGFTGDSTGPHLHLHVGSAAAPLGAEGLPFVIDRFTRRGRYADIGRLGTARWDAEAAGPRRNEHPASNVVVAFSGPP